MSARAYTAEAEALLLALAALDSARIAFDTERRNDRVAFNELAERSEAERVFLRAYKAALERASAAREPEVLDGWDFAQKMEDERDVALAVIRSLHNPVLLARAWFEEAESSAPHPAKWTDSGIDQQTRIAFAARVLDRLAAVAPEA